jgi:hypothetical protein
MFGVGQVLGVQMKAYMVQALTAGAFCLAFLAGEAAYAQ